MKNNQLTTNPLHPKDMKGEEWLEDFHSMYVMMKENYPYLWIKERMNGYNWLDLMDYYTKRISHARTEMEFLEIFFDAVNALQNRHTVILLPEYLEFYYRKDVFFQKIEPFRTIFSDEVRGAYEYWENNLREYARKRFGSYFDVLILYHNGEYRIVNGHGPWKETRGEPSKIVAVNDTPIDEAVTQCYEKGFLDWDFKRKKRFLWLIAPRHFGPDAEFTVRDSCGNEKKVIFQSGIEYTYDNHFRTPEERIITKVWEDKKIGYVQIKSFEDDYMDEDHRILLDFYKRIEDYKYLIIDVRWNEGGSYEPWMRNVIAPLARNKLESRMYLAYRSGDYVNLFRKEAHIHTAVPKDTFASLPPEVETDDFTVYDYTQTVEPSSDINFEGKIIILIDKITFSATDAFALFCKETGFGTFYGIPTGGDGISESPVFYVLPNSKLVIRFTPAMGIDYTGHANEEVRVKPDYYYESEFGNRDELIEYVIENLTSQEE